MVVSFWGLFLTVKLRPTDFPRILFVFNSEHSALFCTKVQNGTVVLYIDDSLTGLNRISTKTTYSDFYHLIRRPLFLFCFFKQLRFANFYTDTIYLLHIVCYLRSTNHFSSFLAFFQWFITWTLSK